MIQQLSDADYSRFRDLARAQTGLEFCEARRPDLERAVFNALNAGFPDLDALFHTLTGNRNGQTVAAYEALIAGLTVGETHFFRNRPQFDALERHILPELIAKRRASRRLRIWSAGCATGEEPYSLAILLQRLLPDLAQWDILLLATDLNRQALEKALRGVYGAWSFREAPQEIQEGYFTRLGREYEIIAPVRNLVTFAPLNLVEGDYPSPANNTNNMDLILFRNVLIYFNEETTRRVVSRLHAALADDGWLVVGHAEPSQVMFSDFITHNFPGTVIYQKRPAALVQRPAVTPVLPAGPIEVVLRKPAPQEGSMRPASVAREQPAGLSVASQAPSRPSSHADIEAALALWQSGQQGEALRRLEAAVKAYPQESRASYLAAKLHANRLQLDAAETHVKIALERAPLSAPAHHLHGLILQEQGRLEDALVALRRCVYADPQFVLGKFALAALLNRLGQAGRAEKVRATVLRLLDSCRPDDPIPEGDGMTAHRLLEMVQTP